MLTPEVILNGFFLKLFVQCIIALRNGLSHSASRFANFTSIKYFFS